MTSTSGSKEHFPLRRGEKKGKASTLRLIGGFVALFGLSTNVYVMLAFHRSGSFQGGRHLDHRRGGGIRPPSPRRRMKRPGSGGGGSGDGQGAARRERLRGGRDGDTAAQGASVAGRVGFDPGAISHLTRYHAYLSESHHENEGRGAVDRRRQRGANDAQVYSDNLQEQREQQQREQQQQRQQHFVDPPPRGWEHFDFFDVRDYFGCSRYAHNTRKPLPTAREWKLFRETYRRIVDPSARFEDDPVPPEMGYSLDEGGYLPPYSAGRGERGRGLFATRDIKKGELVHDGSRSDVVFPSGMAWREYVFGLPRDRACDMIDWSWTQLDDDEGGSVADGDEDDGIETNGGRGAYGMRGKGRYRIRSAMNISILMNGGDPDVPGETNVGPPSSLSSKFYATRDIGRGEELMMDYTVYDTVWEAVGLGRS